MITGEKKDKILFQKLKIIKKFSNHELKLYQYFRSKINVNPNNIVVLDKYIFFFVDNLYYFHAARSLPAIRRELINNKILFFRSERILYKLLFSLFPDLYIHHINASENNTAKEIIISLQFIFDEDRGIAVGPAGEYIKTINRFFRDYVVTDYSMFPIRIKCEKTELRGEIQDNFIKKTWKNLGYLEFLDNY